jgi:hypothetical protein
MADPMQVIAERNLRSYVERHVPEGPDRQAALRCIETLAGLRAAPEGFVMVPEDSVLPCGCGCHRVCCRYCGTELGGFDAARPQGVKDAQ